MEEAIIVGAPTVLIDAKYVASGIGSVASHEARTMDGWPTGRSGTNRRARRRRCTGNPCRRRSRVAASDCGPPRKRCGTSWWPPMTPRKRRDRDLECGDPATTLHVQEEKQHRNIASITDQALVELAGADVHDHEPNPDWTARFFNEAQDVSSEEMQVLWAKVLAGEVERPGSTSLRALSVLRELDRTVAGAFQRFCSASVSIRPDGHSIVDARVPSLGGKAAQNALAQHGFRFGDLNVLEEYGLTKVGL